MSDEQQKSRDIEMLARMAARFAGRDPDQQVQLKWGDLVVFDDVVWRHPDFLKRAETAYSVLSFV